ncbi:MAG: hypothetical protein AVDCRST_MAG73-1000, partial [uncultured Thermomicrobiales bacterium]
WSRGPHRPRHSDPDARGRRESPRRRNRRRAASPRPRSAMPPIRWLAAWHD